MMDDRSIEPATESAVSETQENVVAFPSGAAAARSGSASGSGVSWPPGFCMNAKGLFHEQKTKAATKQIRIAGVFKVFAEGRDPVGAGRGLWLSWNDNDGRAHEAFVRRSDLVGSSVDWLKPLNDRGFDGPVEQSKINKLRQALNGCRISARYLMVKRTGWFESTFVLPHLTIGNARGETISFNGRADTARFATKGSLPDWISNVAGRAKGNHRLVFALSVGFAGPVADLLEEESFGFHFFGPSSSGKTTALIAAGSVWGGGGPLGFLSTWRLTDNGAEGLARSHSGTLLALDELGQVDADAAKQLTYMLGNGVGKARSDRDGETKLQAEWRVVTFSTGEIPISSKLEEAGRSGRRQRARAGQLVRMIDIPADAGANLGTFDDCGTLIAADFAGAYKSAALSCYGTAGPEFVRIIAKSVGRNPEEVKIEIRGRIDEFKKRLVNGLSGTDGQVMRGAHRFALAAVAGEMARKALILPWRDGAALDAAEICFHAWMKTRGGTEAHELLLAISALRQAIERHGQSRFQKLGPQGDDDRLMDERAIQNLLGYKYGSEENIVWAFTSAGYHDVLGDVGSIPELSRSLMDRGILIPGPAGRFQVEKKIEGRKYRLYAVRHHALFAESG
jgi:putative DNA primase/helicase